MIFKIKTLKLIFDAILRTWNIFRFSRAQLFLAIFFWLLRIVRVGSQKIFGLRLVLMSTENIQSNKHVWEIENWHSNGSMSNEFEKVGTTVDNHQQFNSGHIMKLHICNLFWDHSPPSYLYGLSHLHHQVTHRRGKKTRLSKSSHYSIFFHHFT